MAQFQSGYLIGLGSNLNPEHNMARIIALLLKCFDTLTLSRVLNIPPVGMNSQHDFLNAVVFIATEQPETELKAICNQIEISLGRDRNDPQSKLKDRPADLDILCTVDTPDDLDRPANTITDEYFLYPLIEEVQAYLGDKPVTQTLAAGQTIVIDNLSFGQTPTTIHRDTGTGDKRIG